MGIFSRLSDIINSNLNALLEKAEDPQKIIRLMIQEMEDTLVEIRSAAAKCIAERKERQRYVQMLKRQAGDWERKAELALAKDREDLARAALAEKAAISGRATQVEAELQAIEQQLDKFNHDIAQLQTKLADAKARQRSIVMRHKTATSQLRVRKQIHNEKVDEMLHRFEAAERRIDSVESEAEAMDIGRRRTLNDEISDLETADKVNAELEALKKKVKTDQKKSDKNAK